MINFKIKKSHIIFIYFAACVVKIVLASLQYPWLYPGYAPIDDDLMFDAAVSITNGNWLGEYSYLTISKHMFFSIWLSFIHFLNIPYLVANTLLWIAAAFYAIKAFKPVIKSDIGLWFLFCGILYNPAISASFSLRVYRDSFFPIISMFFFFSIIAIGLRYKDNFKNLIFHYIILGISFGVSYLTREDGYWALPFLLVAFIVLIYKWFKNNDKEKIKKTFAIFIPIAISISIIFSYCYMNYIHYGRFIISDFTSSDFNNAYGAMSSIENDDDNILVTVSEDVRNKLAAEVPSFDRINHYFSESTFRLAYYNNEAQDYLSGSFYWALRLALEFEGLYDSSNTAKEYYETLTDEIQLAVNEGRLNTYNGSNNLRTSVTPIIKFSHVVPTINETFNGFTTALFFKQCNPIPDGATGEDEDIIAMGDYINQHATTVRKDGHFESHLDLIRIPTHSFLKFMNVVYTVCVPIMFIIAIFWQIKQAIVLKHDKKEDINNMLNLILFGVISMAILRCAMIGFMEVAAFGIGTYGMYLSTVYPLIIIYAFVGFIKTFEN